MMMLDVAANIISVPALRSEHLAEAAGLVGRHGFARPLRTLDALQLAVATDLSRLGMPDTFVVSDKQLAEVARDEGLLVLMP